MEGSGRGEEETFLELFNARSEEYVAIICIFGTTKIEGYAGYVMDVMDDHFVCMWNSAPLMGKATAF